MYSNGSNFFYLYRRLPYMSCCAFMSVYDRYPVRADDHRVRSLVLFWSSPISSIQMIAAAFRRRAEHCIVKLASTHSTQLLRYFQCPLT